MAVIPYVFEATASASTTPSIELSASPTIDLRTIPIKFNVQDDKIPKRFGGKELSSKQIIKLRYK